MALCRSTVDHPGMSDHGLHYVEEDLREGWFQEWVSTGVVELEDYLAKHGAFLDFLGTEE
jgi:hypothetical protein